MGNTAIIILNYKSWEDTLQEVFEVKRLFSLESDDIVVIDNCSPNNSEEKLRQESEGNFVFLKSDANNGYAAGNNIGLRYAFGKGYQYGLILNNDIVIDDPQLLGKLLNVFSYDSSVASVNPDIYSPNGRMFNRDAKRPSLYDFTLGLYAYKKKGRKLDDHGGYGYVYRPQGCCMMLDLKKAQEVEYLDEHTFLYCEEIILAEKLLAKGYRCACCSDAKIIHNHSQTVRSTFAKQKVVKMNNQSFRYYLKEYRKFGKIMTTLCCFFNYLKLNLLSS